MNLMMNIAKRGFHAKSLPTMTKMSHMRLNLRDFNEKLPLIKQNVINRKAESIHFYLTNFCRICKSRFS
jgi:hypothetical protein